MKHTQNNIEDLMLAKDLLHKVEGGLRYYDPILGPGDQLPPACRNRICIGLTPMYGGAIDRHLLLTTDGN